MYKRKILIILLIFMASFIHYQEGKSASKSVSKKEKKKPKLWLTDFKKAKKEAKKSKKRIFILFTGSDWCPPCKKLHSEILSKDAFIKYAKKNFVLTKIDFPRGRKLSKEESKQNSSLAYTYKISGYPTIIITDPEGKSIARGGYTGVTAEIFVKQLKNFFSEYKKKLKEKEKK